MKQKLSFQAGNTLLIGSIGGRSGVPIRMLYLGNQIFLMASGKIKHFPDFWMAVLDERYDQGVLQVL